MEGLYIFNLFFHSLLSFGDCDSGGDGNEFIGVSLFLCSFLCSWFCATGISYLVLELIRVVFLIVSLPNLICFLCLISYQETSKWNRIVCPAYSIHS